MDENFKSYLMWLEKCYYLHKLIEKNEDEEDGEGDKLRDEMDDLWDKISPELQKTLWRSSEALYKIKERKCIGD